MSFARHQSASPSDEYTGAVDLAEQGDYAAGTAFASLFPSIFSLAAFIAGFCDADVAAAVLDTRPSTAFPDDRANRRCRLQPSSSIVGSAWHNTGASSLVARPKD
jgi:hypothetical protein